VSARLVGVVLASVTILAACGSDEEAAQGTSASPEAASSSTVPSKLAPPELPPGHPPIPFDPCLAIEPSVFNELGLDPSTLEREDLTGDMTSSIGCGIKGESFSVGIYAGNDSYDTQLADDRELRTPDRPPVQETSIDGRDTYYGLSRTGDSTCVVVMRTGFGHVHVEGAFLVPDRVVAERGLDLCAENLRVATAIEPSLPEGS
jgi:hypothetical protein